MNHQHGTPATYAAAIHDEYQCLQGEMGFQEQLPDFLRLAGDRRNALDGNDCMSSIKTIHCEIFP
jgi:hypothetical protein